jgi:hypothetical protein
MVNFTSLKKPFVGLAAILMMSGVAAGQSSSQKTPPAQPGQPNTLMDRLKNAPPSGPAPVHDLSGAWAGGIMAKLNPIPEMTPLGQKLDAANKNAGKYSILESNDPFKTCDPLGFPRDILFMTRGLMFAQMPDRMLQLHQYNRTWREIYTDGRQLPKNVGSRTVRQAQAPGPWLSTFSDSTDPKWFGYSVGHWEGDYTFVVDSVGSDARSWLDNSGHPHSLDLHVHERYTRVDHDTLKVTITIEDPKIYTKPFEITTSTFKWIPSQEFEEQICVPSEEEMYLKNVAEPAGNFGGGTEYDSTTK